MKKASQVLIESQTTRKQITGNLIELDENVSNPKIAGYCALGALACEAKLITEDNKYNVFEDGLNYVTILLKYGLNPYAQVSHPLVGSTRAVFAMIYTLNDRCELSFKDIGEWLATIEDQIQLPEKFKDITEITPEIEEELMQLSNHS